MTVRPQGGRHSHVDGEDSLALSGKGKIKLAIALVGAAAVIVAAIITAAFNSSGNGTQISQNGNGNTACANNSKC